MFQSKKPPKFSDVQSQSGWPEIERSMKKILVESYKSIDDEFLLEARKHKPVLKDGTTATTLLLLNKVFYCANVGDSKVRVLYVQEWQGPGK